MAKLTPTLSGAALSNPLTTNPMIRIPRFIMSHYSMAIHCIITCPLARPLSRDKSWAEIGGGCGFFASGMHAMLHRFAKKKALNGQGLCRAISQNGRAGTFQCNYHCVCEFVECKPSNRRFYPPCYLTHMLLNRIKPIINAVRVNI